jgi:hypothetical protein
MRELLTADGLLARLQAKGFTVEAPARPVATTP